MVLTVSERIVVGRDLPTEMIVYHRYTIKSSVDESVPSGGFLICAVKVIHLGPLSRPTHRTDNFASTCNFIDDGPMVWEGVVYYPRPFNICLDHFTPLTFSLASSMISWNKSSSSMSRAIRTNHVSVVD